MIGDTWSPGIDQEGRVAGHPYFLGPRKRSILGTPVWPSPCGLSRDLGPRAVCRPSDRPGALTAE